MFIRTFAAPAIALAAPAIALAGLAMLATGAFAAPAQTLGQLDLHSGPGVHYTVLGTLGGNTHVDVLYCGSDVKWCLIGKNGKQGWVMPEQLASLGSARGDGSVKTAPRKDPIGSLTSRGDGGSSLEGPRTPHVIQTIKTVKSMAPN
jgi:uncharacterized protein YraI